MNDNTSSMTIDKNRDIANKLKAIEKLVKEKLSANWVSVRKAFLDLDADKDGNVTAEELAKFLGGASTQAIDFNMLKTLVKMRNKN